MLKGMIVSLLGVMIFTILLGMLLVLMINMFLESNVVISEMLHAVRAAEFSNLVKYMISDSDGLIPMAKLRSALSGFNSIGLTKNVATVKGILFEEKFDIQGSSADYTHDSVMSLKRDWIPVNFETTVIMSRGRRYIINTYKVNNNWMVDIYPSAKCTNAASAGGYSMISCMAMASLAAAEPKVIRSIRESTWIAWPGTSVVSILSDKDIIPKDFVNKDYIFARPDECVQAPNPQDGYSGLPLKTICFRIVGDFNTPEILSAGINKDDSFFGGR